MDSHYIDDIVVVFVQNLNENLVGIYLHGSLAMGCFNPTKSDVDLLVVCKDEIPVETKKRMINQLLLVTADKANALEMSIILKRDLINFVYPTPFELHFFHPKYLTDKDYICGGKGFVDPDLAGHIMVTYHRGIKLFGKDINSVFKPIDKKYYIQSIFNDSKDAEQTILENPVYFTLNLCRVLFYLKEGVVSSKREGGIWGKNYLPVQYKGLVEQCLMNYNGDRKELHINDEELVDFSKWMLDEIKQLYNY